ncbi:uncharacterized protein LOC107492529 isoform X2 [Arachis duranensis]|uniref:Uncharacterized protein LOC107492529 isoform X2 n=1 Tax=Arachis duranensis TaxID=130453 RepID=A0A9C6T4Q8_ARADU|nr:uncharacterized protein LOC107492529 isoform X2 [Arachis duranensis]
MKTMTTLKLNSGQFMILFSNVTRFISFSPSYLTLSHQHPLPFLSTFHRTHIQSPTLVKSYSHPIPDSDDQVEDLCIPDHWLEPTMALQESEWLRITLHKWLDDEYCPEETNVEISRIAAQSYYNSLLQKQTDLAMIFKILRLTLRIVVLERTDGKE